MQVFSSSEIYPTEYARVILAPSYYVLDASDFEIALLEVLYPDKFYRLSHSQVLGSLLHQLGLERKSLEISWLGRGKFIFMWMHVSLPYFKENLRKIAKATVKIREIDCRDRIFVEEPSKIKDLLVTSVRLDKLVASTFKLARSVAVQLIQSGQVKGKLCAN